MIDVPLMYGPMRNNHLVQNPFGEETWETNMGNSGVDKDVSDILSYILAESPIHKENDDETLENNYVTGNEHVHEYIEVNIVITHVGFVNNHDDKIKFSSKGKKDNTLEDMEKILRPCVKISMEAYLWVML